MSRIKPEPPTLKSSTKSPYLTYKLYLRFFKSGSIFLYILVRKYFEYLVLLLIASTAIRIFSDWWIGTYSSTAHAQKDAGRYIGIYIAITCSSAILLLMSGLISPHISALGTETIMSNAMKRAFYA